MFPQLDPSEARFLAEIIVSIFGVVFFLGLALWMIRRKQAAKPGEPTPAPASLPETAELKAMNPDEQSDRVTALLQEYQTWKKERLLRGEDGNSLFIRTGVEKNGLRYQLVASTQVQALAIYLSTLMAENDPQASVQAEALFASVLAYPAYRNNELSSWKYLPDLPRSPKLDPDPHAEAWLIYLLVMATKRWPTIDRFHYSELIPTRLQALQEYAETLAPEMTAQLSFSGFLTHQLINLDPSLDWSALGESREQFFNLFVEHEYFTSETVLRKLGLNLLQMGMLALFDHDLQAIQALHKMQADLVEFVEEWLVGLQAEPEFSRSAMLACAVPALLNLDVKELNERVWEALLNSQPDKDDGLGATLKVLGMVFLAGHRE
mgnify:FL=1|jgi:hypothetical protein